MKSWERERGESGESEWEREGGSWRELRSLDGDFGKVGKDG